MNTVMNTVWGFGRRPVGHSCTIPTNTHLPPQLIFSHRFRSKGQWKKLVVLNSTELLDSFEFCRWKLPMLLYFLAEYMWWLNVSMSSGKKGKNSNEYRFPLSEQVCRNHVYYYMATREALESTETTQHVRRVWVQEEALRMWPNPFQFLCEHFTPQTNVSV